MNLTMPIAGLAALSLVAISATDAAARHKHHKMRHVASPSAAYVPALPRDAGTGRPPWAQPWECFTDEGYGRYRPCNAGRSR